MRPGKRKALTRSADDRWAETVEKVKAKIGQNGLFIKMKAYSDLPWNEETVFIFLEDAPSKIFSIASTMSSG